MRIIGLAGGAGSGKDTVARFLQEAAPHEVRVFRFADRIKEFTAKVFEYPKAVLWGESQFRNTPCTISHAQALDHFYEHAPAFVEQIIGQTHLYHEIGLDAALGVWFNTLWACCPQPTARIALQTLGTDFGRVVHPDIWARLTMCEIERSKAKIAVISDCRFINEFRAVRQIDGELWHLLRDTTTGINAHASERDVRSPELAQLRTTLINNNDSLLALHKRVMELL
jgi:hypothetical protein